MERDREREGIRTGVYSQPGREGAERAGEGGGLGKETGREDGFFSRWSRVLGKERECVVSGTALGVPLDNWGIPT
jgi:hypothetical protein